MKNSPKPKSRSLAFRLFLTTTVMLCVFLGGTGLVLDRIFALSLDNLVREKLQLQTYLLLAAADNDSGIIYLPDQVSEQRFNTVEDSLIAIVTDEQQKEFWRSVSFGDKQFSLSPPDSGQWWFGQTQDSSDDVHYVSSYSTIWSDTQGQKTTYVFTVMESAGVYRADVSNYRFMVRPDCHAGTSRQSYH